DVYVNVADPRARGHRRIDRRSVAEFTEQFFHVDRLASRMLPAVRRRRVGTGLRIAERPAPRRLKGGLYAVTVEIPQVDRLGNQMVGRRDLHPVPQCPNGKLRQIRSPRHVDRHVIQAGRALHDGPHCASFEHDQNPAARTKPHLTTVLGNEIEAEDVAPDHEGLVSIGYGDLYGTKPGRQRQRGGAADARLRFDGEDHLCLLWDSGSYRATW